ncbi:hypothetical protein JOF56_005199 [Kibdelosporangium banguiense]|uniref:Protein kinase domain-containing protein n=1 Tax=Kibdelosporangium banguiense TaxID=1365924 RepID=A0ABS4TK58_9PSEU|nr:hypothetical protein [Kibdelosporangium banguiense]MBP2324814.1 hypothetical protein [Kibdelosporangium banguiense]
MSGQIEFVSCRDVWGVLRQIEIEDVNEFRTPGSVLDQRLVRVNGRNYVRKFVSRTAGRRDPQRYDLLENEIRAGCRLGQVFGERFPPDLAGLVAYNVDVEQPFALLREYVGAPAADQVRHFDDGQRKAFEQGLFRAMQNLGVAGIVHGAVTIDAVRWHDGRLQLVDFESAERVGELRRRRSLGQPTGVDQVDVRDDMLAAAILVRHVQPGVPSNGSSPDRSRDPDRLRALLDPVFDNPVDRRPYPADLLAKLRVDNRPPPHDDPDGLLAAGHDLFEHVSQGKLGSQEPEPPGKPSRRRGRWMRSFLALTVVLATTVIGLVVSK